MTTKATVNKEEITTVGAAAEKDTVEAPVVETAEKTVEAPETVTEKTPAKKTTRKTAAKKTPAKTTAKTAAKTTAKKTTAKTTTRKATAKKAAPEMNKEVHIQFAGNDILAKDLVSKAAAVWTEEMGNKAEDIKDVKVYANIDQATAYYVINEDVRGSFPL